MLDYLCFIILYIDGFFTGLDSAQLAEYPAKNPELYSSFSSTAKKWPFKITA